VCGLILGLHIFAKQDANYSAETAFSGAREVLSFLSAQSPQAAHYMEILTLLSKAIDSQREQAAFAGRSKYVKRLFSLEEDSINLDDVGEQDAQMASGEPWSNSAIQLFSPGEQDISGLDGGEVVVGWDSLDLSQWDSFPFLDVVGH
jgi:hypothetical protein